MLTVERGPITRITLNRPEKLNALNRELGNLLIEALETEGFKPDVRVLVIAGAGRAFCAGDDIGAGSASPPTGHDPADPLTYAASSHYYRFQAALRRVPRPVIAQIHGYCLGAGAEIALGADYAVADSAAEIGLVFVKRAIAAGMVLLPAHVGLKEATRLLFEGGHVSAQDALRLGLISQVSAPGCLDADVNALAERLAAGPTHTYGYIKDGLNRAYLREMDGDLRHMAFMQSFARRTDDAAEARLAWRERREPRFAGK